MNHPLSPLFTQTKLPNILEYSKPIVVPAVPAVPEGNDHAGTFDQIKKSYGHHQGNATDWWMGIRSWQEKVAIAISGKQESGLYSYRVK
jgi:hypothetical protein